MSSTSTESSTAPSTPLSSQITPEFSVRAVIVLPGLELHQSCSLDDDVVENVPGLVGRLSAQFDRIFPPDDPDDPFDYEDIKCYPGEYRATISMSPLSIFLS
jgi:hypothetical protein